jgi:signal transduction histidine kinase
VTRARLSVAARAGIAVLGLVVGVLSAALIGGRVTDSATFDTTYGGVSTSFALLEVVVGIGLLAAGLLLLLAERSTAVLGVLAVAASTAWFAPAWVGWEGGPELIRSTGLVLASLLPALVLAVAALLPPKTSGLGRAARLAFVVATTAAAAAASVALALVRDPLRDPYCWRDCAVDAFVVHDDVALARRLTWVALAIGAALGAAAALVGIVRLARASGVTRRWAGPALAATVLAGIAIAAYAVALRVEPREAPGRLLYQWLFVGRSLALLALAGGLAWLAFRPRLVRGRVTRLAVDLERSAADGGLRDILARALGDPGLRLAYPIGSGERLVGADGRTFGPEPSRRVAPLVGEGGVVAFVESDVTVDALEGELGPAAQLALGNERLRAEALARLAEVTGSRARIVERADAARRRIERDLHDGAQQRLLALTYDLRVALTIAESSGNEPAATPLRAALDRAVSASQELRDVAHGIFPAELATSGLGAALESLADLRPLRLAVALPAGRRYRPDVETAAYAVVAEATEEGGPLVVAVVENSGTLHLTVEGDVDWGERLVRLEDRVGAAGGSVRASGRKLEALLPVHQPPNA